MENGIKIQGPGFFSLLALIFITLKLTGVITWSWWWVTAPLWGGLAFVAAIFLIILAALAIFYGCKFIWFAAAYVFHTVVDALDRGCKGKMP